MKLCRMKFDNTRDAKYGKRRHQILDLKSIVHWDQDVTAFQVDFRQCRIVGVVQSVDRT